MSLLIEHLRSFNRKERFAVLRETLGFDPDTPRLDDDFRKRLTSCIGVDVPQPVFLAMDYHLDWIELALHLTRNPQIRLQRPFESPAPERINENQQDVDLLLAFDEACEGRQVTHLVMIEAKAYLSWDNPQLNCKAKRLRKIFGDDGSSHDPIVPRFVLMTAHEPEKIDTKIWPAWMRKGETPFLLRYDLPRRLEITRCTNEGNPSEDGTHLRLRRTPRRNARSAHTK